MEWSKLYKADQQPSMEEMTAYIGNHKLWLSLLDFFERTYRAKPKFTYSNCGGKPGWNVKYGKSGQAFGTLYPEEGFFSVFLVVAYRLDEAMEAVLPEMGEAMAERYRTAPDYMKLGKWMMFEVKDEQTLEDYKRIVKVKLLPK